MAPLDAPLSHDLPATALRVLPVEEVAAAARPRRRRRGWARRRGVGASVLAEVHPFDRYPAAVLDRLGAHADRLRVREGTVIARRGGRAREAVKVLAGEVWTVMGDGDGRPARTLGPGAWIGAGELLATAPHADTLVAGPGLEVVVVNGPAYRWAAATLPGLADDAL
jgi:hypothetical protein